MPDPTQFEVDLTNCDREPIHLLGAVQPFGFLVAVSRSSWVVTRVSRNAAEWLGREGEDLLGLPIDHVFLGQAVHTIRNHLQGAVMGETVARAFGVTMTEAGLVCDVAVHLSGDEVVVECERSVPEPAANAAAMVRGMVARLQRTDDLRNFYRIAAREMQALTGFDRVMIYRFDHDGSGEVIAESARSGIGSFLGLHYPATDIPRQARILYEKNWLRIIPDISAEPSPVEPARDHNDRPLDLSMSILRSVSPIHIEYLQNMGVDASMSVSILREGRLWGLFACHHYAPHHVTFERRTAAELFGQMFSLLVENRERQTEAEYEERSNTLHNKLVAVMAAEATRFESIVDHLDEIADLLVCDGIGLWVEGRATLRGLTPNEDDFAGLAAHLRDRGVNEVCAEHEIGAKYEPARRFSDRAAGMLVVPLSRQPGDYLVFFRKEVTRSVNWAGNPEKPVSVGPLGARLTPRKSFEMWKETVSGQSMPWSPVEERIAEGLRVSLLEVILQLSNLTEAERRRAQERQKLLIAELNHRVRNILSLIRGVINQSKDATSIEAFTEVVGGRIQALARAHDQITSDDWSPASFRNLVTTEAGAYLGGKADRVVLTGSDVLVQPEAFTTVALVIHELITNSAKYGALSDSRGQIDIITDFDPLGRLTIDWGERGGPPVKPPKRYGFGSTVIEQSIVHDLGGEAKVDYELTGLKARFVIPPKHFQRSEIVVDRLHEAPRADEGGNALPADVLVVEDNMIIALDTEQMLLSLGVGRVRAASGVSDALKEIERQAPDFALLDVNLGAETSLEIAERLAGMDVPFVFATGYGEQAALPAPFDATYKVRKPYSAQSLQEAMAGAERV
ncbi:HWE histidine kinase domain-containing protein [Afifella marina]|uniref:histidine kinase n=1 Tax=Afifella marina DSM 2698 TaxID=1120955 RepID=A0A1G5P4Y3_AFIMA|nr:HWE histidine kinase domain-containing protein [Afifella marina]MBK1625087.1 two-component system sensor histidine kinase/response regulator [Afifella marina DSM 2698]MBK1628791.1 two-component system sensor histidine kinase/response regulator [Afifella marina]MBK5918449.1 two-component system sensor histidine kinase/response regulator [Afifella marina]RAI19495.1 two-component system sensor histidine kinase/response regulator [Afifella marina DSM 2698]SCZ44239.1 Bacteriophytochrome (light-r